MTDAQCSRAGCRETARWRIDWRNPRIHSGDRHKTWVACDTHREELRAFLDARRFPLEIALLADAATGASP